MLCEYNQSMHVHVHAHIMFKVVEKIHCTYTVYKYTDNRYRYTLYTLYTSTLIIDTDIHYIQCIQVH